MAAPDTISIQKTCRLERVQRFLDSVGRNSRSSKAAYGVALSHFQMFLKSKYKPHDIETVLEALTAERIDVYLLLDSFVSYLVDNLNLNPKTVSLYVAAVRSYFGYHDIDVTPSRFKRRVRMPKRLREDEEPIDSSDIRKILLSCPNRRLKSYLLVLASSGTRALETLAIRNMDCDF
ncbi:MAG TPA: hypothetical protein VH415_13900, partial [Nitrososphaeraceae archaeon]